MSGSGKVPGLVVLMARKWAGEGGTDEQYVRKDRRRTVMPAMTQQRGSDMEQAKRDPIIGNYFIVRDGEGKTIKAGRIRNRTVDGEYNVTIYGQGEPRGELAGTARMEAERWELF